MKETQAHYVQPVFNANYQNTRINSELIKNNQQSVQQGHVSHRSRISHSPPPTANGVIFRPIEFTNSFPAQDRSVSFGQPAMMTSATKVNFIPQTARNAVNPSFEATNRSNSSSRVSYLNVNGQSQKYEQSRAPVVVQANNGIQTVAVRPVSNISNQSSQSQRSVSPSPVPVHPANVMSIQQSKSLNHYQGARTPMPTQIYANPNMTPSLVLQKQSISNRAPVSTNPNQSSQHRILPLASPHLDMRTSDVRVVYQRGSFSPNEEKSRLDEKSRHLSPAAIENENKINNGAVNDMRLQTNQAFPDTIGETEVAQKQNTVAINNLHLIRQIPSTAVDSVVVNEQKNPSYSYPRLGTVPMRRHNTETQKPNASSDFINAQIRQESKPSIQLKQKIQQSKNINNAQPTTNNVYKASNNPGEQFGSPKRVYKSYDEYLEETRKPAKVIQEIQDSQIQTKIQIQYRHPKAQNKTPVLTQALQSNKQIQSRTDQARKTKFVYQSIPIPTVYGYVDVNNDNYNSSKNSAENSFDQVHNGRVLQLQTHTNDLLPYSRQDDFVKQNTYGTSSKQPGQPNPNQQLGNTKLGKPQLQIVSIQTNNRVQYTNQQMQPKSTLLSQETVRPQQMDNISAIREQSQQYEHEGEYSSSLIGSSLQDNLRQISTNNRELDEFEPDSWSKIGGAKQEEPLSNSYKVLGNNYLNPIITTNSYFGVQPQSKPQRSALEATGKINPFVMIEQAQGNKLPRPQTQFQVNEAINKMKFQVNDQNVNQPIMQGAYSFNQKAVQNQNHSQFRSTQMKVTANFNMGSAIQPSKDVNFLSQRIIRDSATSLKTDAITTAKSFPSTDYPINMHTGYVSKPSAENEEESRYNQSELTFDIYDLIDGIYDRELQNGLTKIREVFGRALTRAAY